MRPRGYRRPAKKSKRAIFFRTPLVGMGSFLEEDEPARSFSPADVQRLIQSAGIKPVAGLAKEEIAAQFSDAVSNFILAWRINVSSPPGDKALWAREVAKRAREFLKIMRANPDDGELKSHNKDVSTVLVSLPPPGPFVYYEDEETHAIRRAMAWQPLYLGDNREIRRLVDNLSEHPEAFIPMNEAAIRLGLQGAAYIARLAVTAAEGYKRVERRSRRSPVAILAFVADINDIYRTTFGKEGSLTTNYRKGTRESPAISFTRAVARHTADLLPESPTLPRDSGMRQELLRLAADHNWVADCIRKIRSATWSGRKTRAPVV